MGGEEFSTKYRDQLVKEVEDAFVQFKVHILKQPVTPLEAYRET